MNKVISNIKKMKRTVICEYVGGGHPDKVADQISDALLDAFLEKDSDTRAGIEVMVKDNIVVLGGEVKSTAQIDYDHIVRETMDGICYPADHHLSGDDIKVMNLIGKQSPEISRSVDQDDGIIGAGDQGFCVGFASNETEDLMPLGAYLARQLCKCAVDMHHTFGPDIKSQVVVSYDEEVYEDGSTKNVELRPFWDYGKSFIHINNTYKSAKQKYQAYSLQQVLDILDHEEEGDCGYAHTINQQMQSHAITTLNYLISGMKIRNEELAHRYEELEKALFDERVLHFYDRYKDMERRIFAEMERLHQQKHDLEMALRRGDSSNQDYQRQIQIIIQRIKEAERELAGFKDEEILKAFPEQALPFWRIESYAQKLREK